MTRFILAAALAACLAAVSDRTDARNDTIKLLIKKQRLWLRANRATLVRSA